VSELRALLQGSTGQRRLYAGFYQAAELGGGFALLPQVGIVTSALLNVAGLNTFMAILTSTAGGDLKYLVNFDPPRGTDPLFFAAAGLGFGLQIATWGQRGAPPGATDAPALDLITIIWDGGAGTLSAFRLFATARR
jgi:hypothetical protein